LQIEKAQAADPQERGEIADVMPRIQAFVIEPEQELRDGQIVQSGDPQHILMNC